MISLLLICVWLSKLFVFCDFIFSSFFNEKAGAYQNIVYNEIRDWVKEKYSITQANGYDISLSYFNTIIRINQASPKDKPVYKKVKY